MNCDICGRDILGNPLNVQVEGAKLTVCSDCADLGEPYVEERSGRPLLRARRPSGPVRKLRQERLPKEVEEYDLAEDCSARVAKARRKMGMSQEELAKKVNEKLSVIQKIESGKMVPDMRLLHLLEHVLRVKLLVPKAEVPLTEPLQAGSAARTLGDVARFRGKTGKTLVASP